MSGWVQLGFRLEALTLTFEADAASFPVEVLAIEELGSDAFPTATYR